MINVLYLLIHRIKLTVWPHIVIILTILNQKRIFELFSDGRINTLSCVLQLSEGVTIPNLKQGIIMHAYGNEKKTAQRIGRLLRLNPSETAVCHILCYKGTQDVTWVKSALKSFDSNKIKYYNPLNR